MSELLITKVGTSTIGNGGELCQFTADEIVDQTIAFERRQEQADDEAARSIIISSGALVVTARRMGLSVEQLSAMDAQARYKALAINSDEHDHAELRYLWQGASRRGDVLDYALLGNQYHHMEEHEKWAVSDRLYQNSTGNILSVVNYDDRKGLLASMTSTHEAARNYDNDDTTLSVVKLGLLRGMIRYRSGYGYESQVRGKRAVVAFLTDVDGVKEDASDDNSAVFRELSADDARVIAKDIEDKKVIALRDYALSCGLSAGYIERCEEQGRLRRALVSGRWLDGTMLKESNGGMESKLRNAASIAELIDGDVVIANGRSEYENSLLRAIDGDIGTRITT